MPPQRLRSTARLVFAAAATAATLVSGQEANNVPSSFTSGCVNLKFPAGPDCSLPNIEIFPGSIVLGSHPIVGVRTVSECQTLCGHVPDCGFVTFVENTVFPPGAGGTCLLKPAVSTQTVPDVVFVQRSSSKEALLRFTSAPRGCSAQPACQTVKDAGADACGVATPDFCDSLGGQMISASEKVSFDDRCGVGAAAYGCNAGGYKCCRACKLPAADYSCGDTACFVNGSSYIGNKLLPSSTMSNIQNYQTCQTRCMNTEGCSHWTYLKSDPLSLFGGACMLFDSPEFLRRFNDTTITGTAISGPKSCSNVDTTPVEGESGLRPRPEPVHIDSCFENNVDYPGGDISVSWGILSATACKRECQQHYECRFFTYNGHDYSCYLKDKIVEKKTIEVDMRFVSGAVLCPGEVLQNSPECLTGNTDSPGFDLAEFSSKSAAECRRLCMYDPDCAFIAYLWGRCYFKYQKKPLELSSTGVISGPKLCGMERMPDVRPCFKRGQSYGGADLISIPDLKNVRACQARCQQRPDCNFFVYRSEGSCILKAQGGDLLVAPHHIAGPKYCPFVGCGDTSQECYLWNQNIGFQEQVFAAPSSGGPSRVLLGSADEFSIDSKDPYPYAAGTGEGVESNDSEILRMLSARSTIRGHITNRVSKNPPRSWSARGSVAVDFSAPIKWRAIGFEFRGVLGEGSDEQECLLASPSLFTENGETPPCGGEDRRDLFFPAKLTAQVVLVAPDQSFSGWRFYNSMVREDEDALPPYGPDTLIGEFPLVNEELVISSDINGTLVRPLSPSAYPHHWPRDLESPLDFASGKVHFRYQILQGPPALRRGQRLLINLCIWGDLEDSEACSEAVAVPSPVDPRLWTSTTSTSTTTPLDKSPPDAK